MIDIVSPYSPAECAARLTQLGKRRAFRVSIRQTEISQYHFSVTRLMYFRRFAIVAGNIALIDGETIVYAKAELTPNVKLYYYGVPIVFLFFAVPSLFDSQRDIVAVIFGWLVFGTLIPAMWIVWNYFKRQLARTVVEILTH
ncbi:MAG: hypothetical protein IT320_27065 [Anaerolineae bacterium]|nr:hypothetical protein [Anaerolineae bacterium]